MDFSTVAIDKAHAAAEGRPQVSFVHADLLALPAEVTAEPFDLLFDDGTIDDFRPDPAGGWPGSSPVWPGPAPCC